MAIAVTSGRYDLAIDWVAAAFAAGCAAYAASLLGPLAGYSLLGAALTGGAIVFVAGLAFMKSMRPAGASFALPSIPDVDRLDKREADEEQVLVLDSIWGEVANELDELLLDRPWIDSVPSDELVLDDPLLPPSSNSRVVQLFAPQQLKERIDRHLANARQADRDGTLDVGEAKDDPLSQALAELKRSLRRA